MEMMNVHIASAQYPITAHSGMEAWQAHTRQWVKTGRDSGAQILLFPEYGSMELVSLAGKALFHDIKAQLHALQDYVNPFKTHYQALAKEYMVILVAPSIPVKTVTGFVNRAYVFGSDGQYGYQDKLFMTRFEDEEWGVSPGEKVLTIFEAPWGSFGIQICYDIEVPTGSALLCDAGASIILAPSCTEDRFGASRVHTGAVGTCPENQCYVVASQTVGTSVCSYAVEDNFGYGAFYCTPMPCFLRVRNWQFPLHNRKDGYRLNWIWNTLKQ